MYTVCLRHFQSLFFSWFVFFCGSFSPLLSLANGNNNKETPVFITMGGFQTCPKAPRDISYIGGGSVIDGLVEKTRAVYAAVAAKSRSVLNPPQYFFSCYSGPLALSKNPSKAEQTKTRLTDVVRFTNIALRWNSEGGDSFINDENQETEIHTPTVNDARFLDGMNRSLSRFLSRISNPKIYVYGYSYGGWTAVQTVDYITKTLRHNVQGVAIIDAISPVQCKMGSFVGSIVRYLTQTSTASAENPNCTRAPQDQNRILTTFQPGRFFQNYYQEQFRLIRSGVINATSVVQNELVHVPNNQTWLRIPRTDRYIVIPTPTNQHAKIALLQDEVWNRIESATVSSWTN